MNAVENLKEGTISVAHAISNAADNIADKAADNVAKDHS
jgi:hypothetical protein